MIFITTADLGPINAALNKGDDVRIQRTPEGVKIQSLTVQTLKKRAGNDIDAGKGVGK